MAAWVYFILSAHLIWAFCSLIDKFVISKGHIRNPMVYIVLNGLMNIFLVFLLPFVDFGSITTINFLIAILSSASIMAAILVYYKAVEYEEISRITILYQFVPIFTLLLSFFIIGERLSKNDFIGFAFLIAAGVIVSYHKEKKSFRIGKSFYLMLLSGFLAGIAYVTSKHIFNSMEFWSGVLWLRLTGFVPLLLLLTSSVRNDFAQTFRKMGSGVKSLLGFKMLIDFSALIISDFAILLGPVALVSALASSSGPIFVFILALLASVYIPNIIREELSKTAAFTKILAISLIIIGIIFVNL